MDDSNPLGNEGNLGVFGGNMTSKEDVTKDGDPVLHRPDPSPWSHFSGVDILHGIPDEPHCVGHLWTLNKHG